MKRVARNYLRNIWFPWTVHWEDKTDARFFVRLRWQIVVPLVHGILR